MNLDDLLGTINVADTKLDVQSVPQEEGQPPAQNPLPTTPSTDGKRDAYDMYGAQFKAKYGK